MESVEEGLCLGVSLSGRPSYGRERAVRILLECILVIRIFSVRPESTHAHDTRYHLCHVLASGVFPTLAVTDARGHGSAIAISKKQLWNLFSLDKYVLLNLGPVYTYRHRIRVRVCQIYIV